MDVIGRRRTWFTLSLVIIVPGLIALAVFGLRLGIDFTGGTVVELKGISPEKTGEIVQQIGIDKADIRSVEDGLLVRYRESDQVLPDSENAEAADINEQFRKQLEANGADIARFDAVGPSVSRDLTKNAFISIALMSLAIVLYIALSFRNIPPPVRSVTFGIVAIIALLHDAAILIGVFSIFGKVFDIEVDAYFVTAILTVIGFSVHDTIVVFDRIRENLSRVHGKFNEIVNLSVNETMVRSLNTSFVIVLVLLALFLFGGESIKYFILALLIGMVSGTYSSIFIASPLLVSWSNFAEKKRKK